jgi:hypothetical protein
MFIILVYFFMGCKYTEKFENQGILEGIFNQKQAFFQPQKAFPAQLPKLNIFSAIYTLIS